MGKIVGLIPQPQKDKKEQVEKPAPKPVKKPTVKTEK